MTAESAVTMPTQRTSRSGLLTGGVVAALLLLVVLMAFYNLQQQLPLALWWQGALSPDVADLRQLLFHYSLLPRLTLALLMAPGWGWWACCSSRCCVIRWRSRQRSGWRAARNWA